jgi:hypothetical protein
MRWQFPAGFSTSKHVTIGVSICMFCYVLMGGCSVRNNAEKATDAITRTTQKVIREVTFAGDGLKKVVTVVRFEDNSLQARDDFLDTFHSDIIENLKATCDELIVTDSGGLTQLPKMVSGQADNYALAVIGRQLGVNAVIAGSLNNIRPMDEEQGILWGKDIEYSVEVLIRAAIYDTRTATKTLDESFTDSVAIDEAQYQEIQARGVYSEPQISEALGRLASEMSERICAVLDEQNWNGFVTAVADEKITVSTGGPVGLEKGDILEVFDSGSVLEGLDGQRFFSPGLKIAELEIVSVSDKQAEAVKLSGRGVKKGFVVMKK